MNEALVTLERILDKGGPSWALALGGSLLMCALAALLFSYSAKMIAPAVTSIRETRNRRLAPQQDPGAIPRLEDGDALKALRRHVDERFEEASRTCKRLQETVREEFNRRDAATAAAREDSRGRLERIERLIDNGLSRALFHGERQ